MSGNVLVSNFGQFVDKGLIVDLNNLKGGGPHIAKIIEKGVWGGGGYDQKSRYTQGWEYLTDPQTKFLSNGLIS